jgi:hypothetical protein
MQAQRDESSDPPEMGDCAPERPEPTIVSASPPTIDTPGSDGQETPAVAATSPGTPPSQARRALKLVLTLQPHDGRGFRGLLALGADGCDPLLRSVEVADPAAALALVPALIDEAETRWQIQPHYPTVRPVKAPRSTLAPSRPTDAAPAVVATADSARAGGAQPTPAAKPTTVQLPLFG